jgi:hypothetical protein
VHTNEWWSFRTSALTLLGTYLNKYVVLFRIAIFIVLFRSYYLLQLSSLDVDDDDR